MFAGLENTWVYHHEELYHGDHDYRGELARACDLEKRRLRNKKVITTARQWNESAWGSESIAESLHVSDAITEALRERGELSRYESFSF